MSSIAVIVVKDGKLYAESIHWRAALFLLKGLPMIKRWNQEITKVRLQEFEDYIFVDGDRRLIFSSQEIFPLSELECLKGDYALVAVQ